MQCPPHSKRRLKVDLPQPQVERNCWSRYSDQIPVATVAIDGAANAAILAAQMLALSDPAIDAKLEQMKADMEQGVKAKDAKISAEYSTCK